MRPFSASRNQISMSSDERYLALNPPIRLTTSLRYIKEECAGNAIKRCKRFTRIECAAG